MAGMRSADKASENAAFAARHSANEDKDDPDKGCYLTTFNPKA